MTEGPDTPLTGRQLGDYRIVAPLGAGGMGVVYAAEDIRLRRKVAIKFLAPESVGDQRARQRLLHEARAAAALDHPNICAIYDVAEAEGQSFIVMQYVEGATLADRLRAGPMDPGQTLDVAVKVTEALAAAHEAGIVHRDVKPHNIMLSAQGHVKVLDFGVAKIATQVDVETLTASGLKTIDHAVAGTVPYMSPEQIRNEPLDGRSDLFSLGIVLQELMTGTRPFGGSGTADTIAAILTKDPPPFGELTGGPAPELERIIRKCLEKDRDLRYQSARELVSDLRRLRRDSSSAATTSAPPLRSRRWTRWHYGAAAAAILAAAIITAEIVRRSSAASAIGSVAVLPLVSVNVDKALDYQTEGITDGLIETLSHLSGLKVMARSAVSRYEGKEIDAQTVGRDLGVAAVVAGRIVGVGNDLTVRLELVDADDNSRIWGQQYTLTPSTFLTAVREIPSDVARVLRPRLGSGSTVAARRDTDDPEAQRLYLLGRSSMQKFDRAATMDAVEFFQRAIARDPNYALAHSGLATAYLAVGGPAGSPQLSGKEASRLARVSALKALDLDSDLSESHAALGGVLLVEDWDFAGADREYRRAIELNPNNVDAHHGYGHFLLTVGRFDESLAECRNIQALDPVSGLAIAHFAYHYLITGQLDEAIPAFERYFKEGGSDPGSPLQFGDALYLKGRYNEALEQYLIGHGKNGATPDEIAAIRKAASDGGMRGYLQTRLAQLERRGQAEPNRFPLFSLGTQLASIHTLLGSKERALQMLERQCADRDGACIFLREEVTFAALRSDPRFADLLRRIGLPPL